jgi:ribosomal protein L24
MLVMKELEELTDGDEVMVCGGKHKGKHGILIKTTNKCHQVLIERDS